MDSNCDPFAEFAQAVSDEKSKDDGGGREEDLFAEFVDIACGRLHETGAFDEFEEGSSVLTLPETIRIGCKPTLSLSSYDLIFNELSSRIEYQGKM